MNNGRFGKRQKGSKKLTIVYVNIWPHIFAQADHSALLPVDSGTNKAWHLDGDWVLQSGFGKSILHDAVYT